MSESRPKTVRFMSDLYPTVDGVNPIGEGSGPAVLAWIERKLAVNRQLVEANRE